MLRGSPDVSRKSKHLVRTTLTNTYSDDNTSIGSSQIWTKDTTESHENEEPTHHTVSKSETCVSITESVFEQKSVPTPAKCKSTATDNIQAFEFKKLQLQSDILEEVRNGQYKIKIAPSDLIDFGGQKSYDMTHQLFIQHSGSFLLMFDGRYGLHRQLEEYPVGVTAACK